MISMEEEFDLFAPEPKKRKNFSRNNLGQRKKSDFYETPYSMTEQLLEIEKFSDFEVFYEPAAGNGAISKVLKDRGVTVVENDLYKGGTDFLSDEESCQFNYIITNPPYSLTLEFVQKAKIIADWKIAFLLPTDYLHGLERYLEIYLDEEFPLARVWTFVRRPLLGEPLRNDGKYNTGMQTYAWFIWDRFHRGPAQLGWIDNSQFVLKAGEQ